MNTTYLPNNTHVEDYYRYNVIISWFGVAFSIITSTIAILGNSLVIYAGKQQTANGDSLRYLDNVIKSLAMTDLLFGLIGTPFNCINIYLGR